MRAPCFLRNRVMPLSRRRFDNRPSRIWIVSRQRNRAALHSCASRKFRSGLAALNNACGGNRPRAPNRDRSRCPIAQDQPVSGMRRDPYRPNQLDGAGKQRSVAVQQQPINASRPPSDVGTHAIGFAHPCRSKAASSGCPSRRELKSPTIMDGT